MKIYLVFSGTTDHRAKLFEFLNSSVPGYTALQSRGGWQGLPLGGDVLLFFDLDDAVRVSRFLCSDCHQQSAPVLSVNAEEVST